jgi:hypothetical protein
VKRPSRGAVIVVLVGVALLGVALLGGRSDDGPPLDPRSDGPLGTSALVSLLERLGADVELSAGLPTADDDVALVLSDDLDEEQSETILRWARAGGTLVVLDPSSPLTPEALPPELTEDPEELDPGICTIPALADVEVVDGGSAYRYDTGTSRSSCFGSRDFAFVAVETEGSGEVVAVGGAAFVTNDLLGKVDNAVLASTLLAPSPGTTVRFVDAPLPAGGGDKTVGDLISDGVRRAWLQLGAAFLLYAIWRAVRLGRPVPETQPVEIAGSELVAATGRLLERGRAPGPTADVLRWRMRRALSVRFGTGPTTPPSTLAALVAERTGADASRVAQAIGEEPVTTDEELVAVASAIAAVHEEVLR